MWLVGGAGGSEYVVFYLFICLSVYGKNGMGIGTRKGLWKS